MHFWIDKRSQGCGFNGRYLAAPSLSGYGRNQRLFVGGLHPKPMVNPVHRFQSIDGVVNVNLLNSRLGPRENGTESSVHYNASTSNLQNGIDNSASPHDTAAPQIQNTNAANAKLKCGVWIFFAMITFFLASAKYYFHGINIGMETLAFCALLIIILVIGGLVSLYEAITTSTNNPDAAITIPENTTEGEDIRTNNNVTVQNTSEMPPPPYHIAIRLPLQNEIPPPPHPGSIQIDNRDSPPPPYEKAVT